MRFFAFSLVILATLVPQVLAARLPAADSAQETEIAVEANVLRILSSKCVIGVMDTLANDHQMVLKRITVLPPVQGVTIYGLYWLAESPVAPGPGYRARVYISTRPAPDGVLKVLGSSLIEILPPER